VAGPVGRLWDAFSDLARIAERLVKGQPTDHDMVEGLKNEVICRDHRIQELVPMRLIPYEEAVRLAL
jgi:hypothetical protein